MAKKMKPPTKPRPSPPPSKTTAVLAAEKLASESHAGINKFDVPIFD
jgi:hypothetical protein